MYIYNIQYIHICRGSITYLVWKLMLIGVIAELAAGLQDLLIKKSCYGLLNGGEMVTLYDFFPQPIHLQFK